MSASAATTSEVENLIVVMLPHSSRLLGFQLASYRREDCPTCCFLTRNTELTRVDTTESQIHKRSRCVVLSFVWIWIFSSVGVSSFLFTLQPGYTPSIHQPVGLVIAVRCRQFTDVSVDIYCAKGLKVHSTVPYLPSQLREWRVETPVATIFRRRQPLRVRRRRRRTTRTTMSRRASSNQEALNRC